MGKKLAVNNPAPESRLRFFPPPLAMLRRQGRVSSTPPQSGPKFQYEACRYTEVSVYAEVSCRSFGWYTEVQRLHPQSIESWADCAEK